MVSKTTCTACGATILQRTATRLGGLCAPCANGTRAQIDAARRHASAPKPTRLVPPAVIPSAAAITLVLDAIVDPESERDLLALKGALAAVPGASDAADCVPALFHVFERFPWSDGFESFWGILHTLEGIPGYESRLVHSVRCCPGEFNLLMINRLLNGGSSEIEGVSLVALLQEVIDRADTSDRARAEATRHLERHRDMHGPG